MSTKVSKENQGIEHQGTKEKFWFGENQDKLFKIGKHESENWSEVVAFHLAELLGIKCASYTAGSLKEDDGQTKYGVISDSFVDKEAGDRLINANELLTKLIKDYNPDKAYKQREYTFFGSMALNKLLSLDPRLKSDIVKEFIGYLVFDIWIANQDRHHENWGIVVTDAELCLAPSFDHASSMGCRLSQDEKEKRLHTTDVGYSVKAFAKKAKTAMYHSDKILKTYELAEFCHKNYPKEYCFWVGKVSKISEENIKQCFNEIPLDWMSDIDKQFTTKLLQANKEFLNALCIKN